MKAVFRSWLTATALIALTLSAQAPWGDGMSGTGHVQRFLSVVINGVHYDTAAADVRLNGVSGTESDLRVGHQVVVETDGDTDVAVVVNQYDAVRGVVESIVVGDTTLQRAEITLMGQRVTTDIDTIFHGAAVDTVAAGDVVAIGGVRDSTGAVRATVLEVLPVLSEHIVSGQVSAVGADSFSIGGLTIYSPHVSTYAAEGWLAEGEMVMAKGAYDGVDLFAEDVFAITQTATQPDTVFIDRVIEQRDGLVYVDGTRLLLDPAVVFVNGTNADLVADAHVEVTGELMPDGNLMATRIEFVKAAVIRVDGEIEDIDSLAGTLTIGGIQAQWDEDIIMLDRRDGDRHFSPEDVYVSDAVSATLEQTEDGYRVKSMIRHPSVRRLLRGPVQDRSWWYNRVRTAGSDIDDLEDADEHVLNGAHVSLSQLLWDLRAGDDVEISWDDEGRVEKVEGYSDDDDDDHDDDDDTTMMMTSRTKCGRRPEFA